MHEAKPLVLLFVQFCVYDNNHTCSSFDTYSSPLYALDCTFFDIPVNVVYVSHSI